MLNKKLNIKEDYINKLFYIDTKINNKRIRAVSRFKKCDENSALSKIEKRKQEIIKELTLHF